MMELGEIMSMSSDGGTTRSFDLSMTRLWLSSCLRLQNTQGIWRTGNSAGKVQRGAGEEECPFVQALAHICELVQVEHLSDGHT